MTINHRLWIAGAFSVALLGHAHADDAGARRILKGMSDHLTSQKTLSAKFDVSLEVVTPNIEKVQYASSGQILLNRPDKIRASRTGGYNDIELVYDGKKATIFDRDGKTYADIESQGTIDQFLDRVRAEHLIEMPGADLLHADAFAELIGGVMEAKHVGQGVVDGIECEHLAFRNHDTDWQIWIETGGRPLPRKYVITSKTLAAAPQYTLQIREWKTDGAPDPNAFVFKAPQDAKKVGMEALGNIGELPQPIETK